MTLLYLRISNVIGGHTPLQCLLTTFGLVAVVLLYVVIPL
jgi:hypothetical protein